MPDVKLAVRNDVLGKRRALSTESRKQKSQAIVDSLIELSLFKDAMTIATYLPLSSEVDLSRLLRLEHRSKCFVAPRTLPNFELSFHRVTSSDTFETALAARSTDRSCRPRVAKCNRSVSGPTGSL